MTRSVQPCEARLVHFTRQWSRAPGAGDAEGTRGRMLPVVSYVPVQLSIMQAGEHSAQIFCDDWETPVRQQALRQQNMGGLARIAEWSQVRGGQLKWNPLAPGGVTPGDARVRRGGKVVTVEETGTGSLARDDFLWLQRIVSPLSRGTDRLRQWCQRSLTNQIYQYMVLHYKDGFDNNGTLYVNMYLRLRLVPGIFEAPWRHLYQIKIDAEPMLFVNGKKSLGEMYMVPMLYYDETGYGTYEFFCRPPHGKGFEPSKDPLTPAAGLLLNSGAPGSWAWSVVDGSSAYTTRRTMPAAHPVPQSLDEALSFPVVFAKIGEPDPSLDQDPANRTYDTEYIVP